ncbi:translation initiation factor eIF4A [Linnemannia exigua]|uniref:ATP-dependent RNA helicase n=1 Tax=Linnemannia exigua TaxID=604196 RepID=A0AAD4DHR9_9FUNG|nr:translation initiation factor eIF4A [Linnemannia exigua]
MTFPLDYHQFKANYDHAIGSFGRMGLSPRLTEALKTKTIDTPTPVQQQAICPILKGRNVVVKAESGTGRRVAFAIAALQKIDTRQQECQVVILTPDQAGALEVVESLKDLGGAMGIVSWTYPEDEEESSRIIWPPAVHIVVGTPGSVMGHIQALGLSSSSVSLLMITDMDRILLKRLGSAVESIFQLLAPSTSRSNPKLQVALYFDLQTPDLVRITDQLTFTHPQRQEQHGGETVRIFVRKSHLSLERVPHYYVDVSREEWKFETLCDLYELLMLPQIVVFCNTRTSQDRLISLLRAPASPLIDVPVASLHESLSTSERATVMQTYRRGESRILILSTPLTLKHVDVAQVPLILGYDFPLDQEVYLRRCGAWPSRFGRRSFFVSFVIGAEEIAVMRGIEEGLGTEVPEMPMNIADLV